MKHDDEDPDRTQRRLAKGWRQGGFAELLGLTEDEERLVEERIRERYDEITSP